MKTMAMIAATLVATASLGTAAMAQQTKHTLTGQEKTVRYQNDQRQKMWNEERLQPNRASESDTFGMPNRQNPSQENAAQSEAPSSFSVPGSGSAFYNYDADNKSWAYGY